MADPISILGTAGAVVGIVDLLAKTIRRVSELRAQWKIVDAVVATFELQLIALNTALTQIKEWTNTNTDDPHYQLSIDLDHCLSHCQLLVGIISTEIETLTAAEGDQSIASKICFLFRTQGIAEVQKMIDHVTGALTLLLTACNSATLLEQRSTIQEPAVRQKIKKVEDDAQSLLVHRDVDSLQTYLPSKWSITSSKRSLVFDFDSEILPSRIYRKVLQGSVRDSLRRQQADASFLLRTAVKSIARATPIVTRLHQASIDGDYDLVLRLIIRGDDVNKIDNINMTPLSYAAENGNEAVARLLVDAGAELNYPDSKSHAPLFHAIARGHVRVLMLLLDLGADPNAPQNGKTPLASAAAEGNEAVVHILLAYGAIIDSTDADLYTPLCHAIKNAHVGVVKVLLERGGNPNVFTHDRNRRFSDLILATRNGREKVSDLLMVNNPKNKSRAHPLRIHPLRVGDQPKRVIRTPLLWAAQFGNPAIVKLLLEKHADLEARESFSGQTPLSLAARHGHLETVRLLIEYGADVQTTDETQETPLSWASRLGECEIAQLLLESGAQVNAQDWPGRTPLSYAFGSYDSDRCATTVRELIKGGANIELKDRMGRTALSYAAEAGSAVGVFILLEAGAAPSVKDISGRTPLLYAMSQNHSEVISLLNKPADLEDT